MKLLDVVHPAAKTLVDISLSQDAEVHASTNFRMPSRVHQVAEGGEKACNFL